MKRLLITHTDLDGAGCAIIGRGCDPSMEVEYCDYTTVDARLVKAQQEDWDEIIMADISPTKKWWHSPLRDSKERANLVILDHHRGLSGAFRRDEPG